MMEEQVRYGGPWYVHVWPWFIVILLGTTVISGVVTVVIAVQGADPLVVDNYYANGKSINLALEADREAGLREAHAAVQLRNGIAVELNILGDFPETLILDFSHVTRAELDRSFELQRLDSGGYATSNDMPDGRYYATLRPSGPGATWRLRRRITLPEEAHFAMEPSG